MSFFRWGEGDPLPETSAHEHAHRKVCKSFGLSGFWEHSGNASYWVSEGGSDWQVAVIEAGGYLTGGGDSTNDRSAARMFAKTAKVTIKEVEKEARRRL